MEHMKRCRACKSDRMHLFLPLGMHPPANQFVPPEALDEPEPAFPLNAHVCLDCALIQVPDFIPPDFFRNYVYVPSASSTMHDHFAALSETLSRRFVEDSDALIADVGSNDGLFLESCLNLGYRTLGVDPAENLAEIAREKGVDVVTEYFSPSVADSIREEYGPARIIVTTNTFNHIGDLHGFVEGVTRFLEDEGVFVIEVPHAQDLVEKNEFDTIYHEHLSEFSVRSIVELFQFYDMEVFDLERLPVHGGSMRVYGQRKSTDRPVSPVVDEWLAREEEARLFEKETYDAFTARVHQNKSDLLSLLSDLKSKGHRIAGYGAPAKGNTLLNYYGIGPDLLDFLADRNPLKQGLYSPGMRIPVVSAESVLEGQPDSLLILAWNFADEIMEQQHEYRERGGQFILPIPEPHIVK